VTQLILSAARAASQYAAADRNWRWVSPRQASYLAVPAIRARPDTLPTGLLLAGAGGFLDAYTFVGRGGVFANAQTGNIVLLGVEAGERHWLAALLHIPPILAFVLGVALAETLARPAGRRIVRRPARFVLVAEIVVLVIVGALFPQVPNQVVTAAIAFTSALQVSTFRSLQVLTTARRSRRVTCALWSPRPTAGALITMPRRGVRRRG
jgi:uncharacterized membrane protein YoaK (UPF0700 family)